MLWTHHWRPKGQHIVHVIDYKTNYKLLLGHLWIHGKWGDNFDTPSMLQCKFYRDDIKKVEVDSTIFSKAESHITDAKIYLKSDNITKAMHVEISRSHVLETMQSVRRPKKDTFSKNNQVNCHQSFLWYDWTSK